MTSFRNTTKKAIENHKDFYEHILENTHDGVWVTNKDDIIIYANKGMEVIAGVSKILIIGKNVLNDFPEETIREFSSYYLKAKQTLSKTKYEANVTTPDQKKTVQDGWLIPIVNENGFNGMICSIQDITGSKELEKSLKLTQFSLDSAADSIFWVTEDAKLIYVNDAAVNMLGYTSEELTTMYTHDINPNHPPEAWPEHWSEVKERGSFTFESTIKAKDGRIIPVEITVNHIVFDNKEYNCAFARDITKRKQAEKSLQDSKTKLEEMNQIMKAVFDHTHIMAVLLDTNFDFLWVNHSYADTCHYEPSYFHGKNHFDLYPHEENEAIFKRVVDTGEPFFIEGKPFEFPDQPERGVTYWDWSLIPVKDSGKVTSLVFTLLEVTSRKKAEQEVQKEIHLRGILLDNLPCIAMILKEGTREIVISNKFAREIGAVPGKTCYETCVNRSSSCTFCCAPELWEDGKPKHMEVEYEGTYYEIYWAPYSEDLYVHYIFDISDRKKAEIELEKNRNNLESMVKERTIELGISNKYLEESVKELETFSYSIAHDLKAPLRAISGYSGMLREGYLGSLDEEGNRLLSVISDNAVQMGQLIEDILQYSRMVRKPLEKGEVHMKKLTEGVIEEFKGACKDRDIEINVQEMPNCTGDSVMIKQVLVNLISNAIKFTINKQKAEIEVGSKQVDNETVYYVKDNGVGFDMKYSDKLFGLFQRLHSTKEFEGTGVGLAIAQRLMFKHKGRIWPDAKVNEGATFYFSFYMKS